MVDNRSTAIKPALRSRRGRRLSGFPAILTIVPLSMLGTDFSAETATTLAATNESVARTSLWRLLLFVDSR